MKKLLFTTVLLAGFFASAAQTECRIKKAFAFYTVSIPGVQMVDENGNPVPPPIQIERFIYIEWGGTKKPEILSVRYNDTSLTATTTGVEGNAVSAGIQSVNMQERLIRAAKGNALWKIDLYPAAGTIDVKTGCRNIVIKIKCPGKNCQIKLKDEIQLITPPRY